MKRLSILFLFLSFQLSAQTGFFQELIATDGPSYYVSSTGSGSGTGRSPADPWTGAQLQTIVDGGFSGIPRGSVIKLNRGENFDFQYDLDNSNFRFDAYGSGANPNIRGSDDVSGLTWTHAGSNVYYATVATEPKGVYYGGIVAQRAENTSWILVVARPSQTSLTALNSVLGPLNTTEALIGSYLQGKEWRFRPCHRVTITNYTTGSPNGTLALSGTPNQTDATGFDTGSPFKLINRISDIDLVGEWAWVDATDRLYIKTAGGAPTGIRVITRDYGIAISSGVSNVSIRNITFQQQFLEGVRSVTGHHIAIRNCIFEDGQTNAASFTGNGTDIIFNNNIVRRYNNNGLHIGGIIRYEIIRNDFLHIGDQVAISRPIYTYFKAVGTAINLRWDSTATKYSSDQGKIMYNDISDCGYTGITVVGENIEVGYNRINRYLLKWSDGGAIYHSNVYGPIYGGSSNTRFNNIHHNIILHGDDITRTVEGYGTQAQISGIQCDREGSYTTFDHNYVAYIQNDGIRINRSNEGHTVTNNIVIAADNGYSFNKGTPSTLFPNADKHVMSGNLCVTGGSSQRCLRMEDEAAGTYNPFGNGGSCNNNRYINPYSTSVVQTVFATTTDYTLSGWQAVFSLDGSSTSSTDFLIIQAGETAKGLLDVLTDTNWGSSSNTTLNTSSDNYYLDETGAHVTSATITPYSGRVLIRNWSPTGSILVDDTYTGGAGNLTGHTRDTGGNWTIDAGTFALDGSGYVTCSVTGSFVENTGNATVIMETTGQVSAGSNAIIIIFRQISNTDKCIARISVSGTPSASTVNVFANSTSIKSRTFTHAINTDYRIKINSKGGTVGVWVNDVLRIDIAGDATLAAENPSTTRHGVNLPTTGKHTRTTIYNTSF